MIAVTRANVCARRRFQSGYEPCDFRRSGFRRSVAVSSPLRAPPPRAGQRTGSTRHGCLLDGSRPPTGTWAQQRTPAAAASRVAPAHAAPAVPAEMQLPGALQAGRYAFWPKTLPGAACRGPTPTSRRATQRPGTSPWVQDAFGLGARAGGSGGAFAAAGLMQSR